MGQVPSPFGRYTYPKHQGGYLGSANNTCNITFMQMAKPIIEDFIIPWLIQTQKNTTAKNDQYPKINLVIKFYRSDEIAGMDFLMNPSFIYRLTGVYPKDAVLVQPAHGSSSGSINNRRVIFNYNNLMVYTNADYENLIAGSRVSYQYDNLSPVQILNKLNYQAGNIASIYNQAKNIF